MHRTAVVDVIEAQAVADGLGVRAFARRVGMEPSQWSRILRGRERIGPVTLERIMQAYPDLASSIVDAFSKPNDEVSFTAQVEKVPA